MYKALVILTVLALGLSFALSRSGEKHTAIEKAGERREEADFEVLMTKHGFAPTLLSVKKGDVVRFVNAEPLECDLSDSACFFWPASDPHPTHEFYPGFDPREPIGPGESWTFLFDTEGEWGFHDHFKSRNRGSVEVE
jgi:plastocyanin